MNGISIRCVAAAFFTALAAYFEQIGAALGVLIAVMLLDYLTGMTKAYLSESLCSKKGLRGLIKKLSYLIVVATGSVCDWILSQALARIEVSYALPFLIALLITVWLIINELISILENLASIGIPLPAFLSKLLRHLAVVVEEAGEGAGEEEHHEGG